MLPYIIGGLVVIASIVTFYLTSKSSSSRQVLNKDIFQEFALVQKTVISHNTALYRFGLPRPNDVLGLPIGQHISIAANIDGKEIVRSYTPTSSDDDKGHFDLVIKSYPTGNISRMIGNLGIGDTIRVRGPKGFFNYHKGLVREFGMVAGGTGITPMYQIMQAIAKDPTDTTKVKLIYANVSLDDILLKKELDDLTGNHPNLSVYYVLDSAPVDWTGGVGYVTKEMLEQNIPAPASDVKLLLCGPPPMVSSVKKAAVVLGYEKAKPVSKLDDQVFAF